MSYLNYDGLAYFKSKFTNWVDQNYLSKTTTGNTTIAGNVTFTKPITGDVDGKVKKDWLDQKIDETYIKEIATNDNAGTIVYTKGNGSTNHILIDLLQGATPITNGKAGLVPAPTVSEMNYFLRGDGNWAVPTDVYVNQNLIASSNNNQFPVLLSGTSGTPATKTNATVGYTNVVSVNPLTNALMASQFISKHPTYNRQNAVSSKIQYSLNFTDVVSGVGHNLGEVVGYVDTLANGGEHELGLRLFGNPNVQGTEEDYVYMGVGLSKTNVAYGHAPSTPLPSAHNEPTDIITRDWLARNGSETGLVHTSMNETIDGIKTFTSETKNTSTAGITTTKLTASGKITGTGTAEISGGSGNTPTLSIDGNSSITGNETVGGNISTTNGNISTTNGTISGKTGSIGSGGLTVAGTTTSTGKITGSGGAEISGGDGLVVNGNETVNGEIYKIVNNTPQEYVSYVTNQQETRNTIITNVVKPNGGLAVVSSGADKGKIYVKTGDGLSVTDAGFINVNFKDPEPTFIQSIVENMIDWSGGLAAKPEGYLLAGEYYTDNKGVRRRVTAAQATEQFTGSDGETYYGMKDPNSGKLVVDFSKIDEDTKADILATLDLQYPLTANLYITVDPNGVSEDEITYGIAATDALTHKVAGKWVNYTFKERKSIPFKTIQGAANWISSRINLSTKNAYIEVVAGTYEESVSLPQLSTSTGVAVIRTKSGLKDVIVKPKRNANGSYSSVFHASSGACVWYLSHMICELRLGVVPDVPGIVTGVITATTAGSTIHVFGCDTIVRPERLDEDDVNSQEREEFTGQSYGVRVYQADSGGALHLHPDSLGSNINVKLPSINTAGISVDVLVAARGGAIYFRRSQVPSSLYEENDTEEQKAAKNEIFTSYYVNGSFSTFMSAWQSGITNTVGSGLMIKFPVAPNGTATGRPYGIRSGSHVVSPAAVYLDDSNSYYYVFPGDGTPSVDNSTYCWISTPNNYPPEEPSNG